MYKYKFESHLTMCWINKKLVKIVLKTIYLVKYFAFFTEASSG